jgi:1,4-dihydroxy-2-naphthoate octaprenyltransferase
MSTDLTKLAYKRMWLFLLLVVSSVCPGSIILYMFQWSLFKDLESIKFIIISISLTAPIIFFNTVWYTHFSNLEDQDKEQGKDEEQDKEKESEEITYRNINISSIYSLLILYTAIIIAYLCSFSSFKIFLLIILILEIIYSWGCMKNKKILSIIKYLLKRSL